MNTGECWEDQQDGIRGKGEGDGDKHDQSQLYVYMKAA
jgi:hypothetical protein